MSNSISQTVVANQLAVALSKAGKPARPAQIQIAEHPRKPLRFCVRLGSNQQVLPTQSRIIELVESGKMPTHTAKGARTILLGAVQISPNGIIRVTARVVAVESGVILHAARADAHNSEAGIGQAFSRVVNDLFVRNKQTS